MSRVAFYLWGCRGEQRSPVQIPGWVCTLPDGCRGKSTEEKSPRTSGAAAAQKLAEHHIQPERQAEPPGVAAGLGVGLLVAGVGLARGLQLVQQVLVGVVVGLHVHGGAGFVPGADVVAQALVGQRGVVVPLGGTLILGYAV